MDLERELKLSWKRVWFVGERLVNPMTGAIVATFAGYDHRGRETWDTPAGIETVMFAGFDGERTLWRKSCP